MIGDLLLAWISEAGNGTIADFRARAAWLARTENLDLHESATGRWLRDASALGHCEVDWKHGKWSVAPPVITRLPLADGLAVLVGARRQRLLRAIDEEGVYAEQARRLGSSRDIPPPCTILMPYERTRDLEEYAAALGAVYSGCAAAAIAALLGTTAPAKPTAPPAYDSPFEHLSSFSPQTWAPTLPSRPNPSEGLHREQVNGRWQHLLRREGGWYATDLSRGVFAELARRGETVIRWRPDGDHRTRTGTVIVDWGASLPPLQARALVLCSGFVPRFGSAAETSLYDNVPREIAARVASSLGQTLQTSS
ncbi:hypothetical protein [Microcella sp.]|uniref:hypothetical protein n=1 Tax=Microcella sp. TaxID=1913979 RepID=UPI00256E9972|nr:hypothetical protein [Microcella sp.]MBX9472294.1 hypothetical protein [Microcella sp.]